MSLKWSENVMMKFLELYQKQECLWNHRMSEYKNRGRRENDLRCIVKDMEISGLTTTDLKNKMKTIRTMYSKEHSLVCKSKKSGMGTNELYVPKLFWYKRADLFLNSVTNTRETSSNLNVHDESESETTDNVSETKDDNQPASTSASATFFQNANIQKDAINLDASHNTPKGSQQSKTPKGSYQAKAPKDSFCTPQNRKRKLSSGHENITTITAAIEKLDTVVEKNNTNSEDEFDIFAKYIAVQLQQMPLYDAIICQEELLMGRSQYNTVPSPAVSHAQYRNSPSPAFSHSQYQNTPSPAFSHSQYYSSSSPALPNNIEEESLSQSVSNDQQFGEDSQDYTTSKQCPQKM